MYGYSVCTSYLYLHSYMYIVSIGLLLTVVIRGVPQKWKGFNSFKLPICSTVQIWQGQSLFFTCNVACMLCSVAP